MAMVRERASDCGTSLRLDLDPDVGVVWADELKLKQVVLNLLTNAVKFTDQGTVVVAARVVGAEVEVTVRDTGIGIAEGEQERIFEAFQRGGRDARRSSEGTGLGLTLSKRIVELHDGRLWVTSEVGVGSTFGFTIPIQPAAALSQARGPRGGQRRRPRRPGLADPGGRGRPALGRPAHALPRRRGAPGGGRRGRRQRPRPRPRDPAAGHHPRRAAAGPGRLGACWRS